MSPESVTPPAAKAEPQSESWMLRSQRDGSRSDFKSFSKYTLASAERKAATRKAAVPRRAFWPVSLAFLASVDVLLKSCTQSTPPERMHKAIHWLALSFLPSTSTDMSAVKMIFDW